MDHLVCVGILGVAVEGNVVVVGLVTGIFQSIRHGMVVVQSLNFTVMIGNVNSGQNNVK